MNNKKKLGIGVIIQNQDNKFLLHLRDKYPVNMPNQWSLIGGGVEKGETLEQAVIREVQEETNLQAKNLHVIKNIVFNYKWDAVVFHAQVDTNKREMTLNEGRKLKFFSKEETIALIKELRYTNPFLDALKEYLNV